LLVVLLACLGAAGAPVYAQQTTPDLDMYERWLREAQVAAQRQDMLSLEDVADELIDTERVRVGDDSVVPVDNTWLETALENPDPDFSQIAERLGALLDALAQPEASAPANAQERLQDIFSRPPFATIEPSEGGNWFFDLLEWFFNGLERLLSPVAEAGASSGNVLGWILIAICVLLLAGVLLYLFFKLRFALTKEAEAAKDKDPEANLTATTAFQQAGNLARGGDYRTAVRYLYLSSLLWLDERDLLRYDRALTNQEYLARLGNNPQLQARLMPIVTTFDRVWYGHAQLDDEGFQTYQQQVEELRKPLS
jgi:hypothetical protein